MLQAIRKKLQLVGVEIEDGLESGTYSDETSFI